jgi:CDP-diglyceride synthetase
MEVTMKKENTVAIIIVIATLIITAWLGYLAVSALGEALKKKDSERAHRANWI